MVSMRTKTKLALHLSVCAGLLSIIPAVASAKITVPYGPNGEPRDPDKEAAVDALNEALEGPENGESTDAWEAELEGAYEWVYGESRDFSDTFPDGLVWGSTCEAPAPSDNLCWSPLAEWLPDGSADMVGVSMHDDAVRSDVENQLEDFFEFVLRRETAGSGVVTSRPIISFSCNACAPTVTPVNVSVPLRFVPYDVTLPFGIGLGRAQAEVSAEIFLRTLNDEQSWCIAVHSYQVDGISAINQLLYGDRLEAVFEDAEYCLAWPAFWT